MSEQNTTQEESKNEKQVELTSVQKRVQKLMKGFFNVTVAQKFDAYSSLEGQKKSEFDENKLKQIVNVTPIEDLGIESSAMDEHIINNQLKKPLLIEIKELRNVSQPYQRGVEKSTKDDPEKEKKKMRKLKNQTFQLKAHDGKRLIKLILLFQDQDKFVRTFHEANKYLINDVYVTSAEANTFVIDYPEQLVPVYLDKYSPKLNEDYQMLQGLPLKYTNAPRFVFLNEDAGEAGEKSQKEQDDEFADLFKQFDVADLTSSERTFIKRFEQLGFWRKRFTQQHAVIEEESKQQ